MDWKHPLLEQLANEVEDLMDIYYIGSVIVIPSVRFELRDPNLSGNHGDHLTPQLHHALGHPQKGYERILSAAAKCAI
jgi:hypothetical protein